MHLISQRVYEIDATDPASGTLLDYGRRIYTPPAGLADFVRARDLYCRNPICGQRAATADLDHTVAWDDDGTTSDHNLYAACRRHHRVKTFTPGGTSTNAPTTGSPGPPPPDTPTPAIPTTDPEPPADSPDSRASAGARADPPDPDPPPSDRKSPDLFDADYGEYRTFGDESWTIEMDDLLDRSGAVFLAGDATLAQGAYRVLLEVLGRDDAESGFPGAGTPEELISSDIGEAKARYLRSGWESEPLATRAAALVEAAGSVGYLAGDPSLGVGDADGSGPRWQYCMAIL